MDIKIVKPKRLTYSSFLTLFRGLIKVKVQCGMCSRAYKDKIIPSGGTLISFCPHCNTGNDVGVFNDFFGSRV